VKQYQFQIAVKTDGSRGTAYLALLSAFARRQPDGCEFTIKNSKTRESKLTEREQEILSHISSGYTTQQSADRLGISPRTIQVHRNNIRLKLGMKKMIQLHVYAGRNGK
jgi:DNA-binding NarL/FixJ family response regulator